MHLGSSWASVRNIYILIKFYGKLLECYDDSETITASVTVGTVTHEKLAWPEEVSTLHTKLESADNDADKLIYFTVINNECLEVIWRESLMSGGDH